MDGKFILVENRQPLCCIVILKGASLTEKFAAQELQKYLFLMSGAKMEIFGECNPVKARKAILMGRCSLFPQAGEISEEENDTILIKTIDGDTLFIGGNNRRSVLYAVYAFLEELGCRWVYPLKSEQVVPIKRTIAVGQMDKKITARLKIRALDLEPPVKRESPLILGYIDWMAKNRFNMLSTHPGVYGTDLWSTDMIRWESVKDQVLPELKKRGILLNMNVHNLFYFLSPERYYPEHPEWFSVRQEGYEDSDSSNTDVVAENLIRFFEDPTEIIRPYDLGQKIYPKWLSFERGHRVPSQICYSNKDAVKTYTRNVLEYIEMHPEVDILGLWPADGSNYCQCERCRADPFVILKVVNNIAKEIYRMNKNLIVEHIVYGERSRQVPPEDMDISPNLLVFVCYDGYEEWLPWLKRNLKQGFYRGEYALGDNYANRGVVYLKPGQAKRWVDSLVEDDFCGYSSFYIETSSWWRSAFNYYFLSKAGFEGVASVEGMLKDYCDSYFGRFSGKAYQILSSLLFEVQYAEGTYATKIPPVEGVVGKNERVFNRIEGILSSLEKEVGEEGEVSSRLKRLHTYLAFVRSSTAAYFLRGEALVAEKAGKARESVEKMLEVARLEERMQRLCQESFLNDDGVLDYRLFIYRRKWRFLEDKKMLERFRRSRKNVQFT